MTDRFSRDRSFSIDEARRIAMVNGFKLCREKDTGRYEFVRALSANHEPAKWDDLRKDMDEKGLIISGSENHLKIVRVSEGFL